MAPQVTRICIVYGCVVFAFIGLRSLTVPESFGKAGHYRGAAIGMLESHPLKFQGKQACIDCHQNNSPHTDKGVSCETCHGPGAAHAKDFDSAKMPVPKTRAFCGTCHAMETARRSSFPQIDMSDHYANQRCVECHVIHPDNPAPIDTLTKAASAESGATAAPAVPAAKSAVPTTKKESKK